jgi:hypothetical protein
MLDSALPRKAKDRITGLEGEQGQGCGRFVSSNTVEPYAHGEIEQAGEGRVVTAKLPH